MKVLRYVGWVIVAALLLAACGGDEDKKDDKPTVTNHDALSRLNLGEAAPDFTLPTAGGGMVSLADYKGKQPVLLFFHMAVG